MILTLVAVKAVPIAPASEPNKLDDLDDEAEGTAAGRSNTAPSVLSDCNDDVLRWESRLTLTGFTSTYFCNIKGSHLNA